MKKVLIALGGLSVAGALAAFPAQVAAHGGDPHAKDMTWAAAMNHPLVVNGSTKLTIVHVQNGCHDWSNGKRTAAGAKLFLRRGQTLTVLNQDIEMHRLVRLSGPRVALGPALNMNASTTVRFAKAGVYRLQTKRSEMRGMPEMETSGPDHTLALVVVVR